MAPEEQENGVPRDTILAGDCREALAALPDQCVDLVFADPPYNLQLSDGELLRPNHSRVNGVADAWDSFADFAEYDAFTEAWLSACRRVMKDTATLWVIGAYHNIYRVGKILQDLGFWILNDLVWIKTNPMPQFRGVRFANAHETLIWAKKNAAQKQYTFNYQLMKHLNEGKQMRSDWRFPICGGRERLRRGGQKLHSTQKPEALLERVILASTKPGDLILDPFFGTGTTGAAAKRLGRHWLGVEREAAYREAAAARIAAVKAQPAPETRLPVLEKRRLPRVPFAALVAGGWIAPGATLYYNGSETVTATVQPDGTLRLGDAEGSIHAMGARAGALPACNGWGHWFYREQPGGKLRPLDDLRGAYRKEKQRDA